MRSKFKLVLGLVLCAAASSPGAASTRYISAADSNVVTDTQTGLVWQANPSYAQLWWDAADICTKATDAGRTWQLPSIEQLTTLLEDNANDHPVTNPASLFPNMTLDCYFGTSPLNQSSPTGTAQVTCFNGLGYTHWTHNNSRNAVRCVTAK